MARQITVRCNREIALTIIESLKWFVERNYPRGADECSIAAREALLDVVARFETELLGQGVSQYSSRVRAFLCEAVKTHFAYQAQSNGYVYQHRMQIVVDVCRGDSSGSGFEEALQRDLESSG